MLICLLYCSAFILLSLNVLHVFLSLVPFLLPNCSHQIPWKSEFQMIANTYSFSKKIYIVVCRFTLNSFFRTCENRDLWSQGNPSTASIFPDKSPKPTAQCILRQENELILWLLLYLCIWWYCFANRTDWLFLWYRQHWFIRRS